MAKPATIDEARTLIAQYGLITPDQFLSILRFRGFEVDQVERVLEKLPPESTKCDDCNATILPENIVRCDACDHVLCNEHIYVCSSCNNIFCAVHVKRQTLNPPRFLCFSCEWEQQQLLESLETEGF